MQDKEVLLSISSNHKMDKFLGVSNNLHFIEYRDYFRIGARKGFFEPLVFLNLFDKQARIIEEFLKGEEPKPSEAINHLKSLPLNEEQKHVLFGIILKYYGGYPVIKGNDGGAVYAFCLLLEDEFLGYVGDTPEKEFCKRNWRETSLDSKSLKEAFDLVRGYLIETDNKFNDDDKTHLRNDIYKQLESNSKIQKLNILNGILKGYNEQIDKIYNLYELVKYLELIKREVEAEPNTIQAPLSPQTGFNLGYSETQLKALHKALICNNFLDNQTKEAHFINAFNGKVLINFERLKWIDLSPTRKEINSKTIYEFLYLLKMPIATYKTDANEKDNFYRKIERIFESVPNLTEKNPSKIEGNTVRKIELQTIISNLNLI